eukprot:Em0011g1046a
MIPSIGLTVLVLLSSLRCARSQAVEITWNGQTVKNNSLVSLSAVQPRVNATTSAAQAPLVCQGITGGQWYDPSGVLFPLATPDPVSTPGGLGQQNVSGGVELYRGTSSVFPHGVQCCTNTTITLCVGMYSDLTLANATNLATSNGYNYGLSVAATYGPNITGGVQFQRLTPTNVDPPVFQLTCTSTSSPPTDVLWTTNGSPVSNTSSQIVTDRPTSTYNNILTVTGRAYGMYKCTVTTTCSPVCGGFTLNPRSTTSFLTVQAPPGPPTGVTAVQSGPPSVSVSWTAPTSGGPVTRYDIYYVANGGPSTYGGSTNFNSYVLTNFQVGVLYNISVIAVGTSLPSQSASSSVVVVPGQAVGITWYGQVFRNNSLVSLSAVQPRVSATTSSRQYPLLCQRITGGQWYDPSGVLFPLATPDPVSTPGGLGQRNVSGGVELYRGTPSVFPHGVQCCTNTTITLCVGMYSDLTLAASVNLATFNANNYGLSVAATYGPNITGGVQFQLLTPTNVDPPVFQLTCTSTSSPPTDVLWTTNGSPVSNTSSQIVTDRPTSTYNNTLTVTGRAYGMYTCTVTTTYSPDTGFTLNPRSTTSSLTVEAPPVPPTGVTAVQSGPTYISVSWTAPTSGGPVTRYDIYYVANGGPSTYGGSTNSTLYDLTNLQVGVQYNISVIAVGTSLPSLSTSSSVVVVSVGPVVGLQAFNKTFTTITLTWQPPPVPNGVIIMYQVTYSTNGVVNTYNTTTPLMTVTGLVPRTTYTFSVTAYTITAPGTPLQVQTSTADIPHVTGVVVSAINTTSVRVSWLAVQLPPDGILTGYTVYYLPNTSKRQSGGYTNHTFPPTTTSGDINNLNPNGVYQFSVVAQMTIMGQLYSGEMDTSLVNTPTITPGSSNLISTSYWGGVLAGSLVTEFVVLAVAMVIIAFIIAMHKRKRRKYSKKLSQIAKPNWHTCQTSKAPSSLHHLQA